MFSRESIVIDITNGSVETMDDVILQNPITVVLYYAPWCYISQKTAHHFEKAAQTLKDEVDNQHKLFT